MKSSQKYFFGIGFVVLALLSGCAANDSKAGRAMVLYSNDSSASSQEVAQQIVWSSPRDGLAYADMLAHLDDGTTREFFVAKVDPRQFEFRVVENEDAAKAKSIQEIHDENGSVLSFNGAFFDTNFKAMGLLQDSRKRFHKMVESDLMNGLFLVKCQPSFPYVVELESLKDYVDVPPSKSCDFWIQNGPILVDNVGGIRISKDTGKAAARTALAIDKDGNVLVIILHQNLLNSDNTISLYQFAHLLEENAVFAPMGLHSVLNLDGGPSTGIAINGDYLPEINSVQNVVITLPRVKKI